MKTKVDEITAKVEHAVRENVAHIIFGAVILLMIVLSFVELSADEDGEINWFALLVNMTLQIFVFIPYRWRQKRLSGQAEPYKTNKANYADKVNFMHANNELKRFSDFCELKTEELKKAKQVSMAHAAGIDTVVLEKYLAGEGDCGGLTEKQIQVLEKCKRVKVKAVNPLCITSNSTRVKGYGVDFDDELEDAKSILVKLFPMLLWGCILAYIAMPIFQDPGIQTVVIMLLRIVMCLAAMFSGIMSGDGFVIKKDKVILRRIDFIKLFHEWLAAESAKPNEEMPTHTNQNQCP